MTVWYHAAALLLLANPCALAQPIRHASHWDKMLPTVVLHDVHVAGLSASLDWQRAHGIDNPVEDANDWSMHKSWRAMCGNVQARSILYEPYDPGPNRMFTFKASRCTVQELFDAFVAVRILDFSEGLGGVGPPIVRSEK